jgi:hypothetical protein
MTIATGIGSHPGEDATEYAEAVRVVLGELSAPTGLPYVPELPGRGMTATMTGRGVALATDLAFDLQPAGWRLTGAEGVDQRRARSLLAQDLDQVEEQSQGWRGGFKTQVVGPWTLAATVERPRGDLALADRGMRRELAQALAEGVRRHLADLRRRVPGADRLVVQVDEPALPASTATARSSRPRPAPRSPGSSTRSARAAGSRGCTAAPTTRPSGCSAGPAPPASRSTWPASPRPVTTSSPRPSRRGRAWCSVSSPPPDRPTRGSSPSGCTAGWTCLASSPVPGSASARRAGSPAAYRPRRGAPWPSRSGSRPDCRASEELPAQSVGSTSEDPFRPSARSIVPGSPGTAHTVLEPCTASTSR